VDETVICEPTLCRYQDGHRLYGEDKEAVGWPARIEEGGRFLISKADRGSLGGVIAIQRKGVVIRKRLASSQDGVEVTLGTGRECSMSGWKS